MSNSILKNDINTLDSRISMRMFIADLPRVLNEMFKVIKTVFNTIYDPDTNKLKADSAEIRTLRATTIISNNVAISSQDSTKTINYEQLEDISRRLTQIENILGIDDN